MESKCEELTKCCFETQTVKKPVGNSTAGLNKLQYNERKYPLSLNLVFYSNDQEAL